MNGLADYKQEDILGILAATRLDVVALCETHLQHEEQLADWEREVEDHGHFRWFGRPAAWLAPPQSSEGAASAGHRGRASGGVGILVRKDWALRCTPLRPCEHDCLVAVRVALDSCACSNILFVSLYLAPAGSARQPLNNALLEELEELIQREKQAGSVVCVMGDCNAHIGETPSAIIHDAAAADSSTFIRPDGPMTSGRDGFSRVLRRRSVEQNATAAGRQFVARMDDMGLVILNGLSDVGEGPRAESTRGDTAVIDFLMVDAPHWQWACAVQIHEDASAEVYSDHRLVETSIIIPRARKMRMRCADSACPVAEQAGLPPSISASVSRVRFRASARGDPHFFDAFALACRAQLEPLLRLWSLPPAGLLLLPPVAAANEPGDAAPAAAAGVGSQDNSTEGTWAEFLRAAHAAGEDTIGLVEKPLIGSAAAQHHSTRRPGDHQLQAWRREMRDVHRAFGQRRAEAAARGEQAPPLPPDSQARQKLLASRIKNHRRKAVRERKQREMQKLDRLVPAQWAEGWKLVKKIGGIAPPPTGVPATVLTSAGQESAAPVDVRSTWLAFWANLAQEPAPDDPRFDAAQREELQEELHRQEHGPPFGPLAQAESVAQAGLDAPVTLAEVCAAVGRLANGKAPGCDGVVAEVLKGGGDAMHRALHILCCQAFGTSRVPLDWLRGVIVPIYKDGDQRLPSNYRPITLLSIVGKVYTGVLQARLGNWSEQHGIVVAEQGGFRPGRGCPEQLFTLTELVRLRRLRKQRTFACFLDIRKAYDTVWHAGLRLRLLQSGIHPGPMYAAICSLYSGGQSCLRLGGQAGYTDFFPIEAGVRQGCILSPLLYSIFVDALAREVKRRCPGASVDVLGTTRISLLLYADDIVLLADSAEELQAALDVAAGHARAWRFEFNHSKCGGLRFNCSGRKLPTEPLLLGGRRVDWVQCYRYLGVELLNSPGHAYAAFRARMLASAGRAAGHVAAMGMHSGKLTVPWGVRVYRALVQPLLEYAAEITSLQPWPGAEALHARTAKRILQCPFRASNTAVRGELGWMSMEGRWQLLRVGFWGKLQSMPASRPARQVYDESLLEYHRQARLAEGVPEVPAEEGWCVQRAPAGSPDCARLWCAQLHRDLHSLGLAAFWDAPEACEESMQLQQWKAAYRRAVGTREAAWWRRLVSQRPNLLRLFSSLHDGSQRLQRQEYLCIPHGGWNDRVRVGRVQLTCLRIGCSPLAYHLDNEEHLCLLCGALRDRPDEAHLLLRCSAFREQRKRVMDFINATVRWQQRREARQQQPFAFAALPAADQLRILLGAGKQVAQVGHVWHILTPIIMREVGQWMRHFAEHLRTIRLVDDG